MDRAAIHKLEIGVNRNPTLATLNRYAAALGIRIEWSLKPVDEGESALR
jgi:transcriptional regulator with XRE-family HTH domain